MENLYQDTFLYKLLTWQLPIIKQVLSLIVAHVFFYLYIIRGYSLISMIASLVVGTILYRLVRQPAPVKEEWLSEESAKHLYVGLYVALNKFVQYMRNIIQVKGGMKAVAVSVYFIMVILESCCIHVPVTVGQGRGR